MLWELIDEDEYEAIHRYHIPMGWIVKTTIRMYDNNDVLREEFSTCFIPDSAHRWEV